MNACNSSSNSNNIISNSNNNIISSKNLKSKFFNFKADLLQRQQQQRRRRRHEPRQRFCAQNFSRVGSTCSKPVTWPQREDEGVRAKVATLTTKAAFRARSKRVRAKFKCLQLFFCARVTLHPDTLAPLLLTCIGIFSSLSVGLSSCPTAFPLPPSLSLSLSVFLPFPQPRLRGWLLHPTAAKRRFCYFPSEDMYRSLKTFRPWVAYHLPTYLPSRDTLLIRCTTEEWAGGILHSHLGASWTSGRQRYFYEHLQRRCFVKPTTVWVFKRRFSKSNFFANKKSFSAHLVIEPKEQTNKQTDIKIDRERDKTNKVKWRTRKNLANFFAHSPI